MTIKILDLVADVALKKASFADTINVQGSIKTNSFNAAKIASQFGTKLDLPAAALNDVSITSTFEYSDNAFAVNQLKANIDNSNVTGNFSVSNFDQPTIKTMINIDKININDYVKSTSASKPSSANPVAQASRDKASILPIEDLKKLRVSGRLKVQEMMYEKEKFTNLNCSVSTKNQTISLSPCTIRAYDGSISAKASIALSGNPKINTSISGKGFVIERLSQLVTKKEIVTGQIEMNINLSTQGNSTADWINQNKGSAKLDLKELLVKNFNLNKVLNQNIGKDASDVVQKYLKQSGLDIPFSDSKDTYIKQLDAQANFNGPEVSLKDITGRLKTGDTLTGNANYNVVSNDFEGSIAITIAKHKNHPYLSGIKWPLRCKGNVNESPLSWCQGLDSDKLQSIVETIVKTAAQAKARSLIENKLGIKLDSAKSVEESAKKELKARAQEKVDEQKKKLDDKIKKEAGKALKGLLNF